MGNNQVKKLLFALGAVTASAFGWCLTSFAIIWAAVFGFEKILSLMFPVGLILIVLGGKLYMKALDELTK